jgi:hypothetical protein
LGPDVSAAVIAGELLDESEVRATLSFGELAEAWPAPPGERWEQHQERRLYRPRSQMCAQWIGSVCRPECLEQCGGALLGVRVVDAE